MKRMKRTSHGGFTIVELLIVVVVIAILAAITVVSYNGITNQATDTTVKNDMRQFAQKIELFKVSDSTELYPKGSQLTGLGISFTKSAYDTSINNLIYCIATDSRSWALVGVAKTGKLWTIGSEQSLKEYTATWASAMGTVCPAALANGDGAAGNAWAYAGGPPRVWSTWVE